MASVGVRLTAQLGAGFCATLLRLIDASRLQADDRLTMCKGLQRRTQEEC